MKNPLTSLRSAVETLPLAKTDESRGRLLQVIQHDVKRLDRLISDIADASRLDAELARAEAGRVDLRKLITTVVSVANERRRRGDAAIDLTVEPAPSGTDDPFAISVTTAGWARWSTTSWTMPARSRPRARPSGWPCGGGATPSS